MNRSLHVASALAAPAPKKKIPTKEHCLKVAKLLGETEGVIYVRGRLEENRDDTDTELLFRQESNFFYLTGKWPVIEFSITMLLSLLSLFFFALPSAHAPTTI